MTFRERFLRGDCSIDTIDDWVECWDTSPVSGQTIQKFLGLSNEEYQVWLTGGKQALVNKLTELANVNYLAIHLEWDDLGSRLESLVQELLPMPCGVIIKRMDYYFWEMSLDISADVDEPMSAEICERLKLQDIESDHFVDDDSIDGNQLLALLEQLTHREVSSSHADDYGVWIICKEYRASSPDYAARLVSEYEKRLCNEIRSQHYPTVNRETARHQLFGFKEALKMVGIIPEQQRTVSPNQFYDSASFLDTSQNAPSPISAPEIISSAKQCLIDNGIEPDEAETVLQALGYILLDTDITQENNA